MSVSLVCQLLSFSFYFKAPELLSSEVEKVIETVILSLRK